MIPEYAARSADSGMAILTVAAALARAAVLGLEATIIIKPFVRRNPFSVAITSSDPDPTVSVRTARIGHRASDMYLGEREQFGPESWDYPAALTTYEQQSFLRLSRAEREIDVPLLPADMTVLANRRWPTADAVVAAVASSTFEQAVQELTTTQASGFTEE